MQTSISTVVYVAERSYGLQVDPTSTRRFPSYDDQMIYFKTTSPVPEEYILKLHALGVNNQSIPSLHLQNEILLLLERNNVTAPRILPVKHEVLPDYLHPPDGKDSGSATADGYTTDEAGCSPNPTAYYSSPFADTYRHYLQERQCGGLPAYFSPIPGPTNRTYIGRLFSFIPGTLYLSWRHPYIPLYNSMHPSPCIGGGGDGGAATDDDDDADAVERRAHTTTSPNQCRQQQQPTHDQRHVITQYVDRVHTRIGYELGALQNALSLWPIPPEDYNKVVSDWDPRWSVSTVNTHRDYIKHASEYAKSYAKSRYDHVLSMMQQQQQGGDDQPPSLIDGSPDAGTTHNAGDGEAPPLPVAQHAHQPRYCSCGCIIIPSPFSVIPDEYISSYASIPPQEGDKEVCDACHILNSKCGISAQQRRTLVDSFLDQFEAIYARYKPRLSYSLIHNDVNESNIILSIDDSCPPPVVEASVSPPGQEQHVAEGIPTCDTTTTPSVTPSLPAVSFIDYGDVSISHPVFDLSVCISYLWLPFLDPLRTACIVTHGFSQSRGLTDDELMVIIPGALGRIMISVVIAQMKFRECPWNSYVLSTSPDGWKVMDYLFRSYGTLTRISEEFVSLYRQMFPSSTL